MDRYRSVQLDGGKIALNALAPAGGGAGGAIAPIDGPSPTPASPAAAGADTPDVRDASTASTSAVGLREMRVQELVDIADEAAAARAEGGEDALPDHEQIPFETVRAMIEEGNIALLALFVGAANWGVSGVPDGLEDPAGLGWAGPRLGKGKRPRDFRAGGFSIAHFDRSRFPDLYARFGEPEGIPHNVLYNHRDDDGERVRALSFDQLLDHEVYGPRWLAWAEPLVERDDVLQFCVDLWIEDYWDPSIAENEDIDQAIINSRIRNSVSGVGRRLSGEPIAEQIAGYVSYKTSTRGERGGRRAQRQADQAMRVVALRRWVEANPRGPSIQPL